LPVIVYSYISRRQGGLDAVTVSGTSFTGK